MSQPTAPPARALAAEIDPVRFEVIRNALLAITEEMGATLRRAAYSTNIKTRGDFSCAFFDRELRTIAQAFAQPAHLGSLAHLVPRAIRAYGPERLQPGDGILINDPYQGGVHLNDITLITPVFHEGALLGYVANIAHHVDVGGGAPGSIGVSSEIYQEGLVIPGVRFVKGGQIDPDIFAMIRANFRGTREISGDFRAQTAANRLGVQGIAALVAQHGAATLTQYLDELLSYTERRTRAAFAEFPDGTFSADMLMDGDGVTDEPVKLAATVTIESGRLSVDLTGCDDQRKSPTNATSSQAYSGVVYVLKCLIDPDIPVNDGFYRLIDIKSRPGSVVHAQHPAAVAAGWEIAMQLCDLLFRALAPALPDRVVAGTKGCVCNIAFGGVNPASGEYFTYYETIAGGYGATLSTDGMDAVQSHFQNTENAPVEETETSYPVRIVRYELIENSEGGGRHRGGLGVRRDYLFPGHTPSFSILSDKARYAPWGLFGGEAARPAKYILNPETPKARELPSKITFQLAPDDIVSVQTPGGGGTQSPLERPAEGVALDVALGKISAERARSVYGVVVDPKTQALDAAATAAERGAARLMRALRIGIDIGGTFTDAALVDGETGAIRVVKVLTTPEDPAQGFMTALERGLAECQAGGGDVAAVVHATTVATNAIIEGKTARVGMLVTRGFRDILEIGRQIRSRLYDVHLQKPAPLVPRRFALEVTERLDHEGRVLQALELDGVREAARRLRSEGVEAVVVCLLHSYLNAAHERAVAEVIRQEMPDVFLSVSSDVCPEYREYLRASTTAVNAAVMPIVSRYVDALESRLHALGATAPFYVMQSNGGVMTSASAKARPVYMVESGPAAGVIAAGAIAAPYGYKNVMSFDMGGTTAKVGLIQDGQLRLSTEIEVGAQAITPLGEGKGGGYPVRAPVIDLVEVGAGGGSEAWIDAGGALRVGPRSAGALPGPACYGRGGTTPTITDANLVLGRLNPAYFLGGEMALDANAARRAITDGVATPLTLDPIAAAAGIVEIANAHMIGALRLVSVQRGYDPRDFVLVAFGGAGPLHANALARELGVPAVLVPPNPGIASAVGMLMTDLRHEFVTTRRLRLDTLTPATLESLFAEFLVEGAARLDRDGVPAADRRMLRSVDLRYHGQSFELPIAVPPGALTAADIARLRTDFDAAHERAYGYAAAEDAVELVNVRLAAIGVTPRPRRAPLQAGGREPGAALKGTREVWFTEGWRKTGVFDRAKLLSGNVIAGPAIVEEPDASTLVHPGWEAAVDQHGNLLMRAT